MIDPANASATLEAIEQEARTAALAKVVREGYERDRLVGAIGRLSVPVCLELGRDVALLPGLRAIHRDLGHLIELLEQEAALTPDPEGRTCPGCHERLLVGEVPQGRCMVCELEEEEPRCKPF